MGNTLNGGFITVAATGKQQASSGTSARQALPNTYSGVLPRYVRVSATVPACVRLGDSSVTAAVTDTQVQPGDSAILSVNECTHFAVIQVAAAGIVQVSPLENL